MRRGEAAVRLGKQIGQWLRAQSAHCVSRALLSIIYSEECFIERQRKEPLKCPGPEPSEGLKTRGFGCLGSCHSGLRCLIWDSDRQGALSETTKRAWKQGSGECVSPLEMLKGLPQHQGGKHFSSQNHFAQIQRYPARTGPQPAHWGEWLTSAGRSLPGLLTCTLNWDPGNTFSIGQPSWLS